MLIVEIILTVVAWNKGWKALALIPLGASICLGILLGAAIMSAGGSSAIGALAPAGILIDLSAIGALVVMAFRRHDDTNEAFLKRVQHTAERMKDDARTLTHAAPEDQNRKDVA